MRLTHASILLLIVVSSLTVTAGEGKALRIHMLSGSGEYKSAVSLPKRAKLLEKDGHTCTIASGVKEKEDFANLKNCDVLVVFSKRWKLKDEALEAVQAAATPKPVIGIRTASHAFQTWLAFANEVMGGTYSGHGGSGEVTVTRVEENKKHPVLTGIDSGWKRQGKFYDNPAMSSGKSWTRSGSAVATGRATSTWASSRGA